MRFRDEIAHVVSRIAEDPMLWREREGGYRRVNCPVFPYFIGYFMRNQKIVIAAVAHGHRKTTFTGAISDAISNTIGFFVCLRRPASVYRGALYTFFVLTGVV